MVYLSDTIIEYEHMGEDSEIRNIAQECIDVFWDENRRWDSEAEIEEWLTDMFWKQLKHQGYLSTCSNAGSTIVFTVNT